MSSRYERTLLNHVDSPRDTQYDKNRLHYFRVVRPNLLGKPENKDMWIVVHSDGSAHVCETEGQALSFRKDKNAYVDRIGWESSLGYDDDLGGPL